MDNHALHQSGPYLERRIRLLAENGGDFVDLWNSLDVVSRHLSKNYCPHFGVETDESLIKALKPDSPVARLRVTRPNPFSPPGEVTDYRVFKRDGVWNVDVYTHR